jgi:hypothetical protein
MMYGQGVWYCQKRGLKAVKWPLHGVPPFPDTTLPGLNEAASGQGNNKWSEQDIENMKREIEARMRELGIWKDSP